jgi:hypothetical protein
MKGLSYILLLVFIIVLSKIYQQVCFFEVYQKIMNLEKKQEEVFFLQYDLFANKEFPLCKVKDWAEKIAHMEMIKKVVEINEL